MFFELFGKGFLIGLIFGIPAGAIGALSIQRTLEGGFLYGFFTGLGSSVADVLYAIAGVFGITVITTLLQTYELQCSICGAVLILIYGIIVFSKKDRKESKIKQSGKTYVSGFLTSFTIAVINPSTVFSFLVAFSSFGLIQSYTPWEGAQIVSGVFIGTALWWGLLCAIVSKFQSKITDQIYRVLQKMLGGVLMLFGAAMVFRCLI